MESVSSALALRLPPYDRRAEVAELLRVAPQCWPLEADALGRARELAGEPPAAAPGQVLLCTVDSNEHFAQTWSFQAGCGRRAFGPKARAAWESARHAITRSLPVLWGPTTLVAQLDDYGAVPAGSLPLDQALAAPPATLDGESFGLSFFLAMASRLLRRPVPLHVAASAGLQPTGHVEQVGRLEAKIRALALQAPHVRTLLVASEQADHARAAALRAGAARLEVAGVRSAAHAVELLWPDAADLIVAAGETDEQRRELVGSLLELVLAGRGAALSWRPIHRAASLALERWAGTEGDQRESLAFVAMVAGRHDDNARADALPSPSWLVGLPRALRLEVVANLVQQSADTAHPPPADVLALAEPELVRGPEAFPVHLKLLGAVGRLHAVTGEPALALQLAEEAARGWVGLKQLDQLSFPLSSWFRLAGDLGDADALERAEVFHSRHVAPHLEGRVYLELARARAHVAVGGATLAPRWWEALVDLARQETIEDHVRLSAARWLARAARATGRDLPADVEATLFGEVVADGDRFVLLARADRLHARGDTAGADALVSRLPDRGLVGMLRAAARGASEVDHVLRFFPY